MAFGGSSSSFTLPHTHNQTLANDGGTLSETLTDMGAVTLLSLITDNEGKWSVVNKNIFNSSVIAGVPVGTVEVVT